MLMQEEFESLITGEVLHASAAIEDFYSHKENRGKAWTDVWVPTGRLTDVPCHMPNFADPRLLNI